MKKLAWTWLSVFALSTASLAQQTFPRNGAYDERAGRYAFTNATIVADPQTTINKGTLLIENGKIVDLGPNVKIPKGTVVTDLSGKYIYPSLIELDSDYGMPEVKRATGGRRGGQQLESDKKGAYGWNQAVQPEMRAAELFVVDAKKAADYRKYGWGTLLVHPHDGIVRGTGALVTLDDESANKVLLRDQASAHFSLDKGSSLQSYPGSIMGGVALLRQTYYDADWFAKGGQKEETNLSLASFNQIKNLPSFFENSDKLGILRADNIGDEFGIQYIIRSGGDEYQRIPEVKATNASLLVPLTFPAAPDVEDPWDAEIVSLAELKGWEMAPSNPAALVKAGIPFALTAEGLKNKGDFWTNIRKAIEFGLSKEKALEAITLAPARLVKADELVGSLKKGKLANFLITSDELFNEDNLIHENWIQGKKFIINDMNAADLRGNYKLTVGSNSALRMRISGKANKPDYQITQDTLKIGPKVTLNGGQVTMTYQPDKKKPGTVRLSGYVNGRDIQGQGTLPDGAPIEWSAILDTSPPVSSADTVKAGKPTPKQPTFDDMGKLVYPFLGFGNEEMPKSEAILIKNATVWTNETDGVVTNTDVLVQNGKIGKIGKNLTVSGARTIDGTGKHLTTGIIDEHSHIALFSVNEGGQSSSAEVRQSDVINSEDINIYRQLAGGVTTSQLLHGSANSIGGQSAVIKLKWGEAPAQLWMPEAKYIKFALGENVKQSNWGDAARSRFPQTRMGVEQVFYDHFIRAKEYDLAMKAYKNSRNKTGMTAPRRDL